jgi:hypothetical protein
MTRSTSAPPLSTRSVNTRIGTIELEADYPSAASVEKLYDELDFQRAVQSYIWATPLVSLEALRIANEKQWDVGFNAVGLVDGYTTPVVKALTGNNTTIYAAVFFDLGRDGPVVIDSPEGAYGVIDDAWQRPIAEVGPFGPDKGKGGKFLLLPTGYQDKPPPGYLAATSLTNRGMYIGRAFVKNGDTKSAADILARIKVYPLSKADNPPVTKVVRAGMKPLDSIAPSGFGYWEVLANAIEHETVEPRDCFFYAMLKPLGIAKGKLFRPDARQKKLLTDAAQVGFLMGQTLSVAPRLANAGSYPGTHWEWVLTLNPDQEGENYSQLDERTDYTFEAITVAAGMIKPIVGAGSQYMSAAKEKTGAWLNGGMTYRLHVPPKVPVKEFWSVTVYDNLTRSMIQTDTNHAGIDSHKDLQSNSDGSTDLFFGPTAPTGRESNWIKTLPGKGWFVYFRWYGPTQEFFDKAWKLPDIEKMM